jgi:hypothetical protein
MLALRQPAHAYMHSDRTVSTRTQTVLKLTVALRKLPASICPDLVELVLDRAPANESFRLAMRILSQRVFEPKLVVGEYNRSVILENRRGGFGHRTLIYVFGSAHHNVAEVSVEGLGIVH